VTAGPASSRIAVRSGSEGPRLTHRFLPRLAAALCLCAATVAHAQLSLDPPNPTALDTVRLRYAHAGCVNPDSVRVAQESNRITVEVTRGASHASCGNTPGFYEDFSLGRLPAGEYEATLVVVPGASSAEKSGTLVGPLHVSVSQPLMPALAAPQDNYADMWWNPREPGSALYASQSTEKLFLVWVTYDEEGKPTWLAVPGGSWTRDADNHLHYAGKAYRTSGPAWQKPYDSKALRIAPVGTADFIPLDASHALFTYTVDGVSGSKMLERWRF